jgi:hypothetical protein
MRLLVRYCDDNGFNTVGRIPCDINGTIGPVVFVVVIVLNSRELTDEELCNVRIPATDAFAMAKLHPAIPRPPAMTDRNGENIEYHVNLWTEYGTGTEKEMEAIMRSRTPAAKEKIWKWGY